MIRLAGSVALTWIWGPSRLRGSFILSGGDRLGEVGTTAALGELLSPRAWLLGDALGLVGLLIRSGMRLGLSCL
jgi:hypothetical protein